MLASSQIYLSELHRDGTVKESPVILALLDQSLNIGEGRSVFADREESDKVTSISGRDDDREQPPKGDQHSPCDRAGQAAATWY